MVDENMGATNAAVEKTCNKGPLACFSAQAAFAASFTCLTGGVFLSGLAILMGAGDVLVSYLSVIVNICGVLIMAFAALLERVRSRKKLAVWLTLLSRILTLFLAAIPALVPAGMQLALFIPVVLAAFTLQAQTTVVVNQWMLCFMDGKKNGRYISGRQTLTLSVTVVLSLISGWWMDSMQGRYQGFVLLSSVAALMGAAELLLLLRTPDCEIYTAGRQNCRLRDIISIPLRNRGFISFVVYILVFYMLLYISDSFTMVYMMKYLELPYRTVNILYMLISLPQVVLLGVWGRISDRRGHDFVLRSSIWFFAGETLFMAFASRSSWFILIPAAFLAASVANAGFVIAVFNRRYELMPEDNRIVYDNFYTAAIGLGFIAGPMLGGGVKGVVERTPFLMDAVPFAGIRCLYLISTAGILFLQVMPFIIRRKDGSGR